MRNADIKKVIYGNVYQNASNGYVLTPSELAFEMVSTLPSDVFKSDSTTFLDPICKSGTFLFEITERLYNEGHSISNIQNRIYTIDYNSHSLNTANSYIKKILNRESGSFKVDFKYDFVEKFFNRLVNVITKGKLTTFYEFMSIIIVEKKYKHLMNDLKINVSEFISKYEKVSKLESKLFGEVFTPRQLIDEMLDTLPADVWSNPDLNWLDPAVGIGNFPVAILDRLMDGLSSVISNEDERRKHILEEMLYMCDISVKNLFLLYQLFDKNNEFKLNIHRGSFLEDNFSDKMKEWGIEKFDVVVGNPPFQLVNQPNVKLYPKFVIKSIDILSKVGYLVMVFPSVWTIRPTGQKLNNMVQLFIENTLYKVVLDNNKEWFNIGENTGYILLSKYKIDNFKTKAFDGILYEEVVYNGQKLLQSDEDVIANSIVAKSETISISTGKLPFFEDIDHNTSKEFKFKNKIIFAEKENDELLPIWFSASQLYYTKKENIREGWRVFINLSGYYHHKQHKSKYQRIMFNEGTSTSARSILCDSEEEAKNILSYTTSKLYWFLNDSQKTSGFNGYMLKLPFLGVTKEWTNIELYKYFDLTQEEIDLIEKTIKD